MSTIEAISSSVRVFKKSSKFFIFEISFLNTRLWQACNYKIGDVKKKHNPHKGVKEALRMDINEMNKAMDELRERFKAFEDENSEEVINRKMNVELTLPKMLRLQILLLIIKCLDSYDNPSFYAEASLAICELADRLIEIEGVDD